jgi:hypothetical protein
LAAFQYSVSSVPLTGTGSVIAGTDIAALPANTTFYETNWPLNFAALYVGATNYVSVRAWDVAGTTRTLYDAFYLIRVARSYRAGRHCPPAGNVPTLGHPPSRFRP